MNQNLNNLSLDNQLFDPEAASQAAADNCLVPYFKEALKNAEARLIEKFDAGEDINLILLKRAWLIDQVLNALWRQQAWPNSATFDLVAVGGYGRAELNLYSDIDILLLCDAAPNDDTKTCIELFLTALWDIGLEIGHSVRPVESCIEEAGKEITTATNLLESRVIAGEGQLLAQVTSKFGSPEIWPDNSFYLAKKAEQALRHERHADTEYRLEPHLKQAPGGLRDVHTVIWIARWYLQINTLEDFAQKTQLMTQEEVNQVAECLAFLLKIRFALHAITGRDENRLLFDYQRAVAERLGYVDSETNLAVEQFMQRYYRSVMTLNEFNQLLLQSFDETILEAGQTPKILPINERFQIRNDLIAITHEDVFTQEPSALLEIFVLLGRYQAIKGVHAKTARLLNRYNDLIDENFRNDPKNISLFADILRSPFTLYSILRRMKRYGILGKYIPAFDKIIGKMQFDLFHIYTVDAHTLFVIRNMRRFYLGYDREEFPIASRIAKHLPKTEVLYLAGLFHDIAKGRGGDHSQLGADDAHKFCLQHRFTKWDANMVAWLVKNHLIMSVTAQKKDISDPEIVHEFAELVGDQVRLDYLFTLTVADICATNPKLWNGWRASLMRQLYVETKRVLRRGLEKPIDKQDWIEETRSHALLLLRTDNIWQEDIEPIWQELADDYFLRYSASEIAWHARGILGHGKASAPLVLMQQAASQEHTNATQIFIYSTDAPNLFAATVAAMDLLNLTILDARIMSSQAHFSLDTYVVVDESGSQIEDQQRIEHIQNTLEQTLSDPEHYPDVVAKRLPRRLKSFTVGTEAIISNNLELNESIVEIRTLDRPGLLAQIGDIFSEYKLSVVNARIATLGERAEDVFFVTDAEGQPLSDPDLCKALLSHLKTQLDAKE